MSLLTDIPTWEPTEFVAGDTVTWQFDTIDSIAPGAVLSYAIAGIDVLPWLSSYISALVGTLNTVKIPGAATAGLDAGTYTFTRLLTDSSDRYSQRLPALTIRANPATLMDGQAAPWQEAAITAIEARLAGNATGGMMSYMVDGRQVQNWPLADLARLLNQLRRELRRIRHNYLPKQRLVGFEPVNKTRIPFFDIYGQPWRQ